MQITICPVNPWTVSITVDFSLFLDVLRRCKGVDKNAQAYLNKLRDQIIAEQDRWNEMMHSEIVEAEEPASDVTFEETVDADYLRDVFRPERLHVRGTDV